MPGLLNWQVLARLSPELKNPSRSDELLRPTDQSPEVGRVWVWPEGLEIHRAIRLAYTFRYRRDHTRIRECMSVRRQLIDVYQGPSDGCCHDTCIAAGGLLLCRRHRQCCSEPVGGTARGAESVKGNPSESWVRKVTGLRDLRS